MGVKMKRSILNSLKMKCCKRFLCHFQKFQTTYIAKLTHMARRFLVIVVVFITYYVYVCNKVVPPRVVTHNSYHQTFAFLKNLSDFSVRNDIKSVSVYLFSSMDDITFFSKIFSFQQMDDDAADSFAIVMNDDIVLN